jgi:hypothetical protein
MWNILFFFHPLNQGLNDHTAYGVIMIYTLSSLLFVSLLINQRAKKVERHTLPWLFAASIGFFYGSVTLLEMKGRIEYALINYFWTVLLLQVAIIVAGHLVYRSRLHR